MRLLLFALFVSLACVSLAQNTQSQPASLRTAFTAPLPAVTAPSWLAAPADTGKAGGNCTNNCCMGCFGGDIKYNLFFDSRRTFLHGEQVRMNGIKVGAEMYEKIRFGLGFYDMRQPLDISDRITDDGGRTRTLDFKYNTTYIEYIAYRDFRWELSIPFQYGRGSGVVDSTNVLTGRKGTERTDAVSIIDFGVSGYIRIIPWFGLGAGTGYVFAPSQNRTASRVFSAPYYSIRAKIFLGHLVKAMFLPKKLEEEREAYRKEREERRKR